MRVTGARTPRAPLVGAELPLVPRHPRGAAATPRAMRGIARYRRRPGRIPSSPFRSSGGMRGAVRPLPGMRDGHLQRSGPQHDRHVSAVRRGADRRRPLGAGREPAAGSGRRAPSRRNPKASPARRRPPPCPEGAPRSAPFGDQGRHAVEDPRERPQAVPGVVCLNGRKGGWLDMITKGLPEAWVTGPQVELVPYPAVMVTHAVTDGSALDVFAPRERRRPPSGGAVAAAAGRRVRVTGGTAAALVADARGPRDGRRRPRRAPRAARRAGRVRAAGRRLVVALRPSAPPPPPRTPPCAGRRRPPSSPAT